MTFSNANRRLTSLVFAGSLLASASIAAQSPPTPAPRASTPTTAPTPPRATGATPAPRPGTPAASGGQAASPEQLFSNWDKDRNKQLSLEEFRTGWEEARMANMLVRLEEQFRGSDTNKSGALEAAEYANLPVIKRGGPSAPPLSAFDANKNNSLDFKEYLTLVQAAMKQQGAPGR